MSARGTLPVPASGLRLAWRPWDDTGAVRVTSEAHVRWDNEAWTVEGTLGADDAQFVMRLGLDWRLQQCLLFRDMASPDLWLGTDGRGRWGEVNGAHRPELAGCDVVEFASSPFHHGVAVRGPALGALPVGGVAVVRAARVDVETLGIEVVERAYRRADGARWRWTSAATGDEVEVAVDEYGFAIDEPGAWRRVSG